MDLYKTTSTPRDIFFIFKCSTKLAKLFISAENVYHCDNQDRLPKQYMHA